tara:strand:- start:4506 stop:4700 length:195 start_codon:yes stop_codon:yes gene_type:complete
MKKYKNMDELEKKEFLIKCMKISLEREEMELKLFKEIMKDENKDIRKYIEKKYIKEKNEKIHNR